MSPSMYVWYVCKRVITFWLVYFIVRIQCITHIMYKICVNRLFMLSIRLPVSSRLLVVSGESEVLHGFSTVSGIDTPKTFVAHGSTVHTKEGCAYE